MAHKIVRRPIPAFYGGGTWKYGSVDWEWNGKYDFRIYLQFTPKRIKIGILFSHRIKNKQNND